MRNDYLKDTSWMHGVKGLAILGIVLYHWFDFFSSGMFHYAAHLGGQGVHVFFIMSSFGIALSLSKQTHVNWREWYKRRFSKVLVPYYLSVVIIVISILLWGCFSRDVTGTLARMEINPGSLLATVFLYRAFIEQYVLAINAPWWFVITILEFYGLFPFIYGAYKKWGALKFLCASFLVTVSFQFLYCAVLNSENSVFQKFFLAFLFEYSVGIYLADLYLHKIEIFKRLLFGVGPVLAGLFLEAVGTWLAFQGGFGLALNDVFNALGFFILSVNFSYFLWKTEFARRSMEQLGKLSLGIFILHAPYISLFFRAYQGASLGTAMLLLIPYLVFVVILAKFFTAVGLKKNPWVNKYFDGILK